MLGFAGFRSAGLELLEKVAAEQNEWSQLASMLLLYCEHPPNYRCLPFDLNEASHEADSSLYD